MRDVVRHELNDLHTEFMMTVEDMKKHLRECLHVTVADTANAIIQAITAAPVAIPAYDHIPDTSLLSLLHSFDPTMVRFRSQEQARGLQAVMQRKDHHLVILPTGGGKTLLWMLPAKLLWQHQVIVVIVPYVSLRVDCERRCSALGLTFQQWSVKTKAQNGVVFVAVESAITPPFYEYTSTLVALNKLALLVIDECHLVLTATTYREGFPSLQRLFGLGVPLLFLTATLPPHLTGVFKSTLNLSQLSIIRRTNNYQNIRITVEMVNGRRARVSAVVMKAKQWLPLLKELSGLGLVVCRTVEESKEIAAQLGTTAFYGILSQADKATLFEEWSSGRQRILVSTTACGTGVDLPNVRGIIHCGEPYDMLTYVQNIGRLGRDGQRGISHIVVDHVHCFKQPVDDISGASVLNTMVTMRDKCQKLPISTFTDGVAISCLDNDILCDNCQRVMEGSGGVYGGLTELGGLIRCVITLLY